ncbi:MAG: hypothetical protein R3E95_16585 [Thiolinea sp.]
MQQGAHIVSMSLGGDFHGIIHSLMDGGRYSLEQALSVALDYHAANMSMKPSPAMPGSTSPTSTAH